MVRIGKPKRRIHVEPDHEPARRRSDPSEAPPPTREPKPEREAPRRREKVPA
jgi:hypothetical protein